MCGFEGTQSRYFCELSKAFSGWILSLSYVQQEDTGSRFPKGEESSLIAIQRLIFK
jgi:hypothetical protein